VAAKLKSPEIIHKLFCSYKHVYANARWNLLDSNISSESCLHDKRPDLRKRHHSRIAVFLFLMLKNGSVLATTLSQLLL